MKMNYIVSRIEESQGGAPFVYVTYSNSKAGIEECLIEEWCGPAAYWSVEQLGIVVNEND
jgi:hypothetical protein